MKIRQGFVSNSSSSSFVVMLPKPIETLSFDEFKSWFNLEEFDTYYEVDWDKGVEQLYTNLSNAENPAFGVYILDLGDLRGMEDVEQAYHLAVEIDSYYLTEQKKSLLEKGFSVTDDWEVIKRFRGE